MKFGLWFEPEMVNKDSGLYRAHPDWILSVPERTQSHGRYQYVLDFSRKDVVDCIYEMMAKILGCGRVSYVKWDMNRSITECWSPSLPADRQGEVFHRYILGVYSLYERLTSAFPTVLFESCASGGARFDPRHSLLCTPRLGPAMTRTQWSALKSSTAPPTAIR